MHVIFILLGFSLTASLLFLGAYIWSVKTGQFDDKYTPSVRILFDDKKKLKTKDPNVGSGEKKEGES
jgi:cbb3-type cytochrome oxidase maturation protein